MLAIKETGVSHRLKNSKGELILVLHKFSDKRDLSSFLEIRSLQPNRKRIEVFVIVRGHNF